MFDKPIRLEPKTPPVTIEVLFEDSDFLVVNKPAGLPVHATVDPLRPHVQGILEKERGEKLVLFHRLDVETSGVLVLGRNPRINEPMTDLFRNKSRDSKSSLTKIYWVVVEGRWLEKDLSVESYIRKVTGGRYVSRPKGSSTEWAKTEFRILQSNGERSWLEARLVTGRTHQIRLHCSGKGHPVLGDRRYGAKAEKGVEKAFALHCREMSWRHPSLGNLLRVEAPLPPLWNENWLKPFGILVR
jgi:RluA family pseudouridine synthase